MKTKTYYLLLLLSIYTNTLCRGQTGFSMPPGIRQMDIPFEYVNNFIIITVTFNQTIPLKMIFDTGAEYTILSKRQVSDLLNVRYEKEFRLLGSDLKTELVAYLARQIRLETPGLPFVAPREDILVLQEDYFRFEEYAGVNVHGILSAQTFARYIFKINYQRKVITLYDREDFQLPEEGFQQVPVEIFRNKMYVNTTIAFRPDTTTAVKLLVDTGAALPLLCFSNTNPMVHPPQNAIPSNIGMGLGGYLEGYVGRSDKLHLGSFQQKNIVTYFQSLDTAQARASLNNRNGLIGNMVLSRFMVLIDYYGSTIWLKPAKNYQQRYVFDRSGLILIAGGVALNRFTVQGIIPHSPAAEAGMLPGDRIVRVGLTPTIFWGLSDLQHVFQKHAGKKIRVVIRRDGKKLKKVFRLRDLI